MVVELDTLCVFCFFFLRCFFSRVKFILGVEGIIEIDRLGAVKTTTLKKNTAHLTHKLGFVEIRLTSG